MIAMHWLYGFALVAAIAILALTVLSVHAAANVQVATAIGLASVNADTAASDADLMTKLNDL